MHLRSGEGEPELYMSVSTPFSSTTKPDDMSSSFSAFSKTSFQTKSSVLSQMSSPGSRRFGLRWPPNLASGSLALLAAALSPSPSSRALLGGSVDGSRYVFMAKANVAFSRSTSTTLTCTLSPGDSMASKSSTRSSDTREMCTNPSTPSAMFTKAPQLSTVRTVPSTNSWGSASRYFLSSSAPAFFVLRPPPCLLGGAAAPSGFRESESCFFCSSTLRTLTETASPSETTADTSDTNSVLNSEMWTRPSDWAPMSTKAPYAATPVIVPSYESPTTNWSSGVASFLLLRFGFSSAAASSATTGASSAASAASSMSAAVTGASASALQMCLLTGRTGAANWSAVVAPALSANATMTRCILLSVGGSARGKRYRLQSGGYGDSVNGNGCDTEESTLPAA